MIRLLAILPILTGCNGAEILSGHESPSKAHYERMALVTTSETPEVKVATALDVEPEIIHPCIEEWRVKKCLGGGRAVDWWSGEEIKS